MLNLTKVLTCACPHHKPGDQHHPHPHLEALVLLPKELISVKGSHKSIEDIAPTEESTAEKSYRAHCLNPEYGVKDLCAMLC